MVAKLFKQRIEHHLGILLIQNDYRHGSFTIPIPPIIIWNIKANLTANLFETIQ
jgi:hypothetical protein